GRSVATVKDQRAGVLLEGCLDLVEDPVRARCVTHRHEEREAIGSSPYRCEACARAVLHHVERIEALAGDLRLSVNQRCPALDVEHGLGTMTDPLVAVSSTELLERELLELLAQLRERLRDAEGRHDGGP